MMIQPRFLTKSINQIIIFFLWLPDEDYDVPTISGPKTHPVYHLDIQGFGVARHRHCEINRA